MYYSTDQAWQQAGAHDREVCGHWIAQCYRFLLRIKSPLQLRMHKAVCNCFTIASCTEVSTQVTDGQLRFGLGRHDQIGLNMRYWQSVVAIHPRQFLHQIRLYSDIETPAGNGTGPALRRCSHAQTEARENTLHL